MQITKLRLIGFKSFVEPTELIIENGLTGVVGPNGCGKSNLLEALRWVMGETSYKSMRAAAMDDVIFSGTSSRPARSFAEVTLFIDNQDRTAPAEFNDNDHIEVSRRIERESGSTYAINNRDARARDIKILFEDAATGARSPALVRQGQIGEIVNAKPEQRRRILEDAAGIAGLHTRRHEAELRLKAAEGNLARIGDILGQLKSQLDGLKRQARQARRYADLSGEIRKHEAVLLFLTWQQAQAEVDHEEAELHAALEALGLATRAEGEATRAEALAAAGIQPLRDEETTRAAVVARLRNEQTSLEKDAARAKARCDELDELIRQIVEDTARESSLVTEAGELQTRLRDSLSNLDASDDGDTERKAALETALRQRTAASDAKDKALATLTAELSHAQAQRSAAEASLRERRARADRTASQRSALQAQASAIAAKAPDAARHAAIAADVTRLTGSVTSTETALADAEQQAAATDVTSREAREAREAATLAARQIETEIKTIRQLLNRQEDAGPPEGRALLDQLTVAKGYETALGAVLGDDLEAGTQDTAPLHWRRIDPAADDASLPDGVQPMTAVVEAPPVLERCLRQIGIVEDAHGPALQPELKPGQCLVSKSGAVWRWDGFVAAADAPTAAAQRLALLNRLSECETDRATAQARLDEASRNAETALDRARAAKADEQRLRTALRDEQAALASAGRALSEIEQAARETQGRLKALAETEATLVAEHEAAEQARDEQERALAAMPDLADLRARTDTARAEAAAARDAAAEARAELASLERERAHRTAQRQALQADIVRWSERAEKGRAQIEALERRCDAAKRERADIAELPANLEAQRQRLLGEITRAEAERTAAADAVVAAENQIKEAAAALRKVNEEVTQRRETRARTEARLEGARMKRQGIVQHIRDTLDVSPEGCLGLAGITPEGDGSGPAGLPSLNEAEARLARLKTDRDRLGGVNLQAETELREMEQSYGDMDRERADVEAAIQKLRTGISGLNREGRKRLKEAFEAVDGHFRELFTTLFGGGEARLEMLEDADDPLAGGLEIIAKPPGKKPTSLSLLSGGEQTLTALSLIFAVFLTNPSPICVLDEVDAPLDDANVDRFCTLMEKMSSDTDTRFLVITHHPMTMARMDRLFGVTMIEKGISQLVSVDLSTAETMVEAV